MYEGVSAQALMELAYKNFTSGVGACLANDAPQLVPHVTAIAARRAWQEILSRTLYRACLRHFVLSDPDNLRVPEIGSHLRTLSGDDAIAMLDAFWVHSPYISADGLALARVGTRMQSVNVNTTAAYLWSLNGGAMLGHSQSMYEARVRRMRNAAEIVGFVTLEDGRGNTRAIVGTAFLDSFQTQVWPVIEGLEKRLALLADEHAQGEQFTHAHHTEAAPCAQQKRKARRPLSDGGGGGQGDGHGGK